MPKLEMNVAEIVDDEKGHRVEVHTEYWEYTDEQWRHCNMCTVCQRSGYPECARKCPRGFTIPPLPES